MEKFEISEKYRKYLVRLQLHDSSFFCIWGTDMEQDEADKLLMKDNKVLLFKNLETIKAELLTYEDKFFDKPNFLRWVNEESFKVEYSQVNVSSLLNYDESIVLDSVKSLAFLNALNFVQDFFIQTDNLEMTDIFSSELLKELKSFIYDTYFWKNDHVKESALHFNMDVSRLKIILSKIYSDFYQSCFLS